MRLSPRRRSRMSVNSICCWSLGAVDSRGGKKSHLLGQQRLASATTSAASRSRTTLGAWKISGLSIRSSHSFATDFPRGAICSQRPFTKPSTMPSRKCSSIERSPLSMAPPCSMACCSPVVASSHPFSIGRSESPLQNSSAAFRCCAVDPAASCITSAFLKLVNFSLALFFFFFE